MIFGGDTRYPNVIRYMCEEGYFLNGPRKRQCQSSGKWSGANPTCEGKTCQSLSLTFVVYANLIINVNTSKLRVIMFIR